jgi:hypothetical protein
LLIVFCCLLLSASTVAIVIANATSASASTVNAAFSASTAYAAAAALAFRPGGASRGRGSGHHGQVLVVGREVKKGLFQSIFYLTKSLLLSLARARQRLAGTGIWRNPEENPL